MCAAAVAVEATAAGESGRAGWEVAHIFRRWGPAYRVANALSRARRRVMRAIETCRTARLGGHKEHCTDCGIDRYAYNSCRNRHCPKCQTLVKAQWLEDRKAELLPVPYFHGVFTLPHELNSIVLCNMATLLNMLIGAVSETLLEFGRNNLGGKIGFTLVLHTWDQLLNAHFHVHGVIQAGALSADRSRWIPGDPKFLFPVAALSKVFRGKLVDALEKAFANGGLSFHGAASEHATPQGFANLVQRLRAIDWVVYSKRPFGGPEKVLDYLGRYTHRVAISNHRIVNLGHDEVTFTYRDRRNSNEVKTATLHPNEFIRRFLLHVLPDGFMRIRHFGLLANRYKAENLRRCRVLLGEPVELPPRPKLNAAEWLKKLLGVDITRCPKCGRGPLIRTELPPLAAAALETEPPAVMDTS